MLNINSKTVIQYKYFEGDFKEIKVKHLKLGSGRPPTEKCAYFK